MENNYTERESAPKRHAEKQRIRHLAKLKRKERLRERMASGKGDGNGTDTTVRKMDCRVGEAE